MKQLRTTAAAVLAAGALALAGCGASGVTVITQDRTTGNYSTSFVNQARGYDAVHLDVVGTGLGASQDDYGAAVLDVVRTTGKTRSIPWTLEEPPGSSPFKLVVVADPAAGTNGYDACQGGASSASEQGGTHSMLFAYCLGETKLLSTVTARRAGLTGVDDPGFRSMVRQSVTTLLPLQDEDSGPDAADII